MRITAAVTRDGLPAPRLEEADLSDPRPGELLVRIVATGICHTDIKMHEGGSFPVPRPVVLGHEGAGVVEKVGEGVFHVKPGDHVVLSGASCGLCPNCMANLPTYCREAMPRIFGGQRMDGSSALSQNGEKLHGHFFGQSSFATYAIADARGAVPIAKDIPLNIAAPLGCGIVTGAGSVFYAFDVRPGQTIAIFGAGGVGLSAVMAARLCGAKHIVAIDPIESRRKLAEALGATASVDPTAGDAAEAVIELVPGGVDYSFNTTTSAAVFDAAVKVLATRGTAGFVATPPQPWTVPLLPLLSGGKRLRGILGGDAAPQIAIPVMLDYWRQGRFPIDRLVTQYEFGRIGEAFDDCHHGAAIKPVLNMDVA
jgi:aryl-alcohol dehydrogenase